MDFGPKGVDTSGCRCSASCAVAQGELRVLGPLGIVIDGDPLAHSRRSVGLILRPYYVEKPTHLQRRRETPHKYVGVNHTVADSSNDPEEATIERGRVLLETIVERVAARALVLLTESTSGEDR